MRKSEPPAIQSAPGLSSKTPPEGYSVFLYKAPCVRDRTSSGAVFERVSGGSKNHPAASIRARMRDRLEQDISCASLLTFARWRLSLRRLRDIALYFIGLR